RHAVRDEPIPERNRVATRSARGRKHEEKRCPLTVERHGGLGALRVHHIESGKRVADLEATGRRRAGRGRELRLERSVLPRQEERQDGQRRTGDAEKKGEAVLRVRV